MGGNLQALSGAATWPSFMKITGSIGFVNAARDGRQPQRRDSGCVPRPHVEKWSQKPLTLADACR